MKNIPSIGVQIADILLPKKTIDPGKWAVIACDQFTSEPEYWHAVEKHVGDSPSTLNLILPEVYLEKADTRDRARITQRTMQEYLDGGLLESREGFILVRRTVEGKTRHGLMLALDLERYDFNKGSHSLIRATEGTIVDRLPPRIKIREGAALELPHILVLIDDPQRTVIEPLAANTGQLEKLYDFDLMLGSGHLEGYAINDSDTEQDIISALEELADPAAFRQKYDVGEDQDVLLFAMGDGNHSLATAKAIWEKIKAEVGMDHPARYALVEIENVHDEGLEFEPIHRVIFHLKSDLIADLKTAFGGSLRLVDCDSKQQMIALVDNQTDAGEQAIGLITPAGFQVAYIRNPAFNLPVGTIQDFLDVWLKAGKAENIDYVHGEDVVTRLGSQPGNAGIYLPGMDKSDLFKTVILDGALPRKTFSMGEAREKRFYMECRKIVQ
ncbi:MAG: DUF1015 domain-containing protein [Anaerolineaceae bacterium]|jgi:hypothetical protein|nr:DUF1015 domain-containing protein [Anaerolineaceae bacterium]